MSPSKTEAVWNKVWDRSFSDQENKDDLLSEKASVRWKKLRAKILQRFGSFHGLRVIEIGAGRGIYSLLAALEGASVSLLDNEPLAFSRAEEFFKTWDQKFEALTADAFSLPADLLGRFDVCMSFGFAEHFRYPERLSIFESHVKLVKPGGLIAVSVPNAWFLPYRIGKWILESLKKWSFGLEIPFTRSELARIGKRLDLKKAQVFGSGLISDTLNFWLIQRIFHLPGYGVQLFFKRKTSLPFKNRMTPFKAHPPCPLDDIFGYALVLMGEKGPGQLE